MLFLIKMWILRTGEKIKGNWHSDMASHTKTRKKNALIHTHKLWIVWLKRTHGIAANDNKKLPVYYTTYELNHSGTFLNKFCCAKFKFFKWHENNCAQGKFLESAKFFYFLAGSIFPTLKAWRIKLGCARKRFK